MRSCHLEINAKLYEHALIFSKFTLWNMQVEKVVVSTRLGESPCILTTSKFGWSANMERIMRAQAMGDTKSYEYMKGRKIMEINPSRYHMFSTLCMPFLYFHEFKRALWILQLAEQSAVERVLRVASTSLKWLRSIFSRTCWFCSSRWLTSAGTCCSPIISYLNENCASPDQAVKNQVELLFDTAMLTSGFIIEEPADFATRIFSMVCALESCIAYAK